jgi:hypothetical protein
MIRLIEDIIGNAVIAFFALGLGLIGLCKFIIWFLPFLKSILP